MFQPGFNELRETKVKDSGTFAFTFRYLFSMEPYTRGTDPDKRSQESIRLPIAIVLVKTSCRLADKSADLDSIL